MTTFLEELEEHVGALNRDLLALEKGPAGPERAERLTTLFRTAHSLKGAARAVNVTVIESACHRPRRRGEARRLSGPQRRAAGGAPPRSLAGRGTADRARVRQPVARRLALRRERTGRRPRVARRDAPPHRRGPGAGERQPPPAG